MPAPLQDFTHHALRLFQLARERGRSRGFTDSGFAAYVGLSKGHLHDMLHNRRPLGADLVLLHLDAFLEEEIGAEPVVLPYLAAERGRRLVPVDVSEHTPRAAVIAAAEVAQIGGALVGEVARAAEDGVIDDGEEASALRIIEEARRLVAQAEANIRGARLAANEGVRR